MSTSQSTGAPRRALVCCCCGNGAGRWRQHWNRDTGYGICMACIELERRRGMSAEEIRSNYGTEGINYGRADMSSPRLTPDSRVASRAALTDGYLIIYTDGTRVWCEWGIAP
jgi:hypothetical protein